MRSDPKYPRNLATTVCLARSPARMAPSGGTARATTDLWGRQFCQCSSISLFAMICGNGAVSAARGRIELGFFLLGVGDGPLDGPAPVVPPPALGAASRLRFSALFCHSRRNRTRPEIEHHLVAAVFRKSSEIGKAAGVEPGLRFRPVFYSICTRTLARLFCTERVPRVLLGCVRKFFSFLFMFRNTNRVLMGIRCDLAPGGS